MNIDSFVHAMINQKIILKNFTLKGKVIAHIQVKPEKPVETKACHFPFSKSIYRNYNHSRIKNRKRKNGENTHLNVLNK